MTHANVRASLPFLAIEGSRRGNGDLPLPFLSSRPRVSSRVLHARLLTTPHKLESLLTRQAWADV